MEPLNLYRDEELLVAERAADWLRRLETAGVEERAAFVAWLRESPRHVREILLATAWDQVLTAADRARRFDIDDLLARGGGAVSVLRGGASRESAEGVASERAMAGTGVRRRRRRFAGLAALVGVASVAAWVWVSIFAHTYTTAVGGKRDVALADGSMIYLSAQSKVRVDFSQATRDVYLEAGEAIFKVEHEAARPFRVYVDAAFIQAVGTQFDVHRLADQTRVAVIEGKVKITGQGMGTEGAQRGVGAGGGVGASGGRDVGDGKGAGVGVGAGSGGSASADVGEGVRVRAGMVILGAGEAASIISGGEVTEPGPVDIAEATAWQQRRLVFRKQTLANMALEFNRYNREMQIRVEGDALRARRFNGVFDADDPDSLVRFLESSDGVVVERRGNEVVIRGR